MAVALSSPGRIHLLNNSNLLCRDVDVLSKYVERSIAELEQEYRNVVAEFESCVEASNSFGPQDNASGISQCCNNRKGHVKGYQWRWPGEYPGKYVPPKHIGPKKFGKDNPRSKVVIELDDLGNILKMWDSLMDLVREEGINSGTICNCIKKNRKHKGRTFKYKEN